jgi:hypothetical protein
LDDDVAAAVEQFRKRRSVGVSEAVNELARAGLRSQPVRPKFRQRSAALGIRMDVANVAEALELLEGWDRD